MLKPSLKLACATRRARLRARLGAQPALLWAGRARPRNYAANRYPFRASSHFLYCVGVPLEGAGLWLAPEGERLLVPPVGEHDALWHGPLPGTAELAHELGVEVAPWNELDAVRRGRDVATLAPLELGEAFDLGGRLSRRPDQLGCSDGDLALADALVALRLAHDEAAIGELRRAADVTVAAHLAGMHASRPGVSEQRVCATMEHVIADAGFTTAYGSIVSVHGEVLHNPGHAHQLAAGDLLLADVGAESDTGYAADVTRTWPVSGRFSPTQRVMYELVLAMQARAIEVMRAGVRYRDVHLAAARALVDGLVQLGVMRGEVDGLVEDGQHALFFPHGVGHLLGLDVHDMEDLGDRAGYPAGRARSPRFGLSNLRLDRELAPGMLVTVEPGFYQVPSLLADPARVGLDPRVIDREKLAAYGDVRGIRIEDDVLVTDAGVELLTARLPRATADIESLVAQ